MSSNSNNGSGCSTNLNRFAILGDWASSSFKDEFYSGLNDEQDLGTNDGASSNDDDIELLLLIKALEICLVLSMSFFVIATLRFYVALYKLGLRIDGFQHCLKWWRERILQKYIILGGSKRKQLHL